MAYRKPICRRKQVQLASVRTPKALRLLLYCAHAEPQPHPGLKTATTTTATEPYYYL
jgi:hypothetical protein